MGLKETILKKAGGGKLRKVEEWGVVVLLRGMPASMRLRMTQQGKEGTLVPEELTIEALKAGIRDPEAEGNPPIFTDTELRELLEADQQGVTDVLLGEILELSGITKEALDEAKRRFSESPSVEPSSISPKSSGAPLTNSSPADAGPSDPASSPTG